MADKPTAAFILSLLGGIFILLGGIVLLVIGAVATFFLLGIGGIIGLFGIICGILIIIGAVMMNSRPESHVTWGIVIIIFSILSWFGALAGFYIGFILALIGGILAIIWKPSAAQPITAQPAPAAPIGRICPFCGNVIEKNIKFCPHCGKELP